MRGAVTLSLLVSCKTDSSLNRKHCQVGVLQDFTHWTFDTSDNNSHLRTRCVLLSSANCCQRRATQSVSSHICWRQQVDLTSFFPPLPSVLPSFVKTPRDSTIRTGQTARLECAAEGHPAPQIAWQKDGGTDFPAARERRMHVMPDDDVFFITAVKPEDMGLYSCTAKNTAGTVSANATLTVLGEQHLHHFLLLVSENCANPKYCEKDE